MSLQHRLVEYRDGDVLLEGRLSWDDCHEYPRPGVLVCHTIAGRGPLEELPRLAGLLPQQQQRQSRRPFS